MSSGHLQDKLQRLRAGLENIDGLRDFLKAVCHDLEDVITSIER